MELNRKTWEKGKDWLVTGKGLSAALDVYVAAEAQAVAAKTEAAWKAVLPAVKEVGAQINKNLSKLDKKSHKETCQLLTQLYALAKTKSDAAVAEGRAAIARAGVMARIAEYKQMQTSLTGQLQTSKAALAKLKADVVKASAQLAPGNDKARKMIRDHMDKTVVEAIRKAYTTAQSAPGTLTTIATMYPADSFTTAQQTEITQVCNGMRALVTAFAPIKDAAEAELAKLS